MGTLSHLPLRVLERDFSRCPTYVHHLHAVGYSEGKNIKVEFRYTEGRSDRAEEFAEELVRLNVDVIVAHYAVAVSAAMAATRTIPIVMAPHGAPLQLGAIDGLARPGGNVTGLSAMDAEIGGKRVQLLRRGGSRRCSQAGQD
jgi:putative tryptophan/tyrosine transport system substrate-binding protein